MGTSALARGTRCYGLDPFAKCLVVAGLFSEKKHQTLGVVFQTKALARAAVDHLRLLVGNAQADRVHYLPALDFDYYRGLFPDPDAILERNVALFHLLNDPKDRVFVTSLSTTLQRALPSEDFLAAIQTVRRDAEIDRDVWARDLLRSGYRKQPNALDPGVFSIRGGVIDIYSPLYPHPFRIELFDSLVEEIRFFDAQSQRSLERVDEVQVVPVSAALLPSQEREGAVLEDVKARLDALGISKIERDALCDKIRDGQLPNEGLFLYPLLGSRPATIFEYFPKSTRWVWDGIEEMQQRAEQEELPRLQKSHALFEAQPIPIAAAETLFLEASELNSLMDPDIAFESFDAGKHPGFRLDGYEPDIESARDLARHTGTRTSKSVSNVAGALSAYSTRLGEWFDQGYTVDVVCHTRTHAERFMSLMEPYGLRCLLRTEGTPLLHSISEASPSRTVVLWQGWLSESRIYPDLKRVILSEEIFFGQKKRVSRSVTGAQKAKAEKVLAQFRDLKSGDLVVHKEHGIGRYLGLKPMEFQGVTSDYVLLEYRDGDKLYVPVYRLSVLQKYSVAEGGAPLVDKLGGDGWAKTKSRARKAASALAEEFLRVQALRELNKAHAFSPPAEDYQAFEMEFPYDETPDQWKAIQDVMEDMGKPRPMDRLICGDVGYGKTEVAIRAAFRAVLDKKQVAVLVPTTVLAFQHFESFKARMKDHAVRVEMVSRMREPSVNREVLEGVRQGKVDILVGTHRLLSSDVQFKDLGLVVVDEEHRFGVAQKERLKKLTTTVHLVSMSATPIPRTMNMALGGLRELSIITTPPPDRLAVRTFVCRSSPEVIAEAISNELTRGGQVFFVHNRIETLFEIAGSLRSLLPRVKWEVAHGQMDGDILEKKILSFYRGDAQVLVSTAIIESGVDIPKANTILIDRADMFGLAQLYQLRGRVGRAAERGYCYLLVPPENQMTADAKERLQVIQRYTELGAGFSVATHDLEIRGAGDILGDEQSGHLNAVGIDLYMELLEQSIQLLKGEAVTVEIEPEISLRVPAFFPDGYLPDLSERVQLYRRLSAALDEEALSDLEAEIRDRFGPLPEEVNNLIGLMRIKIRLKRLSVLKMSCGPKRTSLQFDESTAVKPEKIVALIQKDMKRYAVTPDRKLVFSVDGENPDSNWRGQLSAIERLEKDLL